MKNNRIKLNISNFNIDIELRETMTLISGNSGTGKSMFYNLVDKAITLGECNNCLCINFDDVKNKEYGVVMYKLSITSNKIIIIDQANYVLQDPKVAKFINQDIDRGNYYVLIGRSLPIYADARYLAKMKVNGNNIGLRYLFER